MKIIDAIKHEGYPFKIPDAYRDDLPEFFREMGYKVGVEIGVDKGKYTEVLCKGGMKVYGVDPWRYYTDYAHPEGQKRLDELYEHSRRRLEPYDCKLIRKTSMEAVQDFADESIDFVYIDGHHGFKYVAEDLWEWTPKVKKGGVVSGHDYALNAHTSFRDPFVLHVSYALDGYLKSMQIKNWYLIGSDKEQPGEKRDTFRSWFWIR